MLTFDEAIAYLDERYDCNPYDRRDSHDPYLSATIGSLYDLSVYRRDDGWTGKVRSVAGGSGREIPEDGSPLPLPDLCDEADDVIREWLDDEQNRIDEVRAILGEGARPAQVLAETVQDMSPGQVGVHARRHGYSLRDVLQAKRRILEGDTDDS